MKPKFVPRTPARPAPKKESKRIKVYRRESGEEGGPDEYYVALDAGDVPTIKVAGDTVQVGPFGSAEDAAAAVDPSLDPSQIDIVNADETPVVTAEPTDMPGAPAGDVPNPDEIEMTPMKDSKLPTARRTSMLTPASKPARAMTAESLRASVLKDIKEAEQDLDIDTTAGSGQGSTEGASGSDSNEGVASGTNATPADGTATGTNLDTDADRRPKSDTDSSPGTEGNPAPPGGNLVSNGGDIREGATAGATIAMAAFQRGNFCRILTKGEAKLVDSGVLDKVTESGVTIGKTEYTYAKYNVQKIA